MSDEAIHSLVGWLTGLSGTGVWMFVGWALYTKRIVFRREMDREIEIALKDEGGAKSRLAEMVKDRDEWKQQAMRVYEMGARSQGLAKSAVEIAESAKGAVH